MAAYREIGYGAQGDEVRKLQQLLNSSGYSLDTDGIFGDKTLSAVKDYQTKNKLSVDGIVGTNTWGSLEKSVQPKPSASVASAAGTATAQSASQTASPQGEAYVQQFQNPGAAPDYTQKIQAAYDAVINQKPFSYDVNADALWQSLKDQYMASGKLAMQDTMGQAAGLTGGYGSSYAQNVGQQAYNQQLQELSGYIPELEERAYSRYLAEGDALREQYEMLLNEEDRALAKWQNDMKLYLQEQDTLYQKEQDAKNWQYQAEQDALEEAWRQKEWDYGYASMGSGSDGVAAEPTVEFDQQAWENYMTMYEQTGDETYRQMADKLLNAWVNRGEAVDDKVVNTGGIEYEIDAQTQAEINGIGDYMSAMDYLVQNRANVANLMNREKWTAAHDAWKNGYSDTDGAEFGSYEEYLRDYLAYAMWEKNQ